MKSLWNSKCSIDTTVRYLTGLERRLYPKVQEWRSSDPEALVSIASLIHHEKSIFAITADVYDQGHWHVCLVLVDCRLLGRVIDERGTSK
jgi:hypothetical protein